MKLLPALFLLLVLSNCGETDLPRIDEVDTELYFPPIDSEQWEETDPNTLGWNADGIGALEAFIESSKTRAFVILKDGKIAFESYNGSTFGNEPFTKDSFWYWASAGKTLTSFLVGQAEGDGVLELNDPAKTYLGDGWTALEGEEEDRITIHHQLSMTTGLDDKEGDCTDAECFLFEASPGTRWAYHNGPYTQLTAVIENATGGTFSNYFETRLKAKIGMDGFWLTSGFNHVYYSTARSMARFGLLILNQGAWADEVLLSNPVYFEKMTTSSQNLNPSYGYLWWLNGHSKVMAPGLQTVFSATLTQSAPTDMIAAMGKNGQLINVVPSSQLVIIRMGENPEDGLVPFEFQEEMWQRLNEIF